MKILQIFGAVVAVHVLAFIFIFASPGCQSGPRNIPTPDATAPYLQPSAPVTFNAPTPVDMGTAPAAAPTSGYATPTRPGSPNAAAYSPPPKPVAEVAAVATYTVTKGDSLWSIAKKNNISVAELARTNNLTTSSTLQPGKKLIVPGKQPAAPQDLATTSTSTPVEKSMTSTPPRSNGEMITHIVQSGESLGVIARKFGVTVQALSLENNITNPAMVRAGTPLRIPAPRNGSRPASTAAKTTPANTPATAADTPATAATTPQTPATTPPTTQPVTRFEIAPPPPGEDLDASLKSTPVQTIKVPVPSEQPPKG